MITQCDWFCISLIKLSFKLFSSIQAWVSEIQEYANDDVVVMLLGNKSDMVSERVVKKEEAEKLAKVRH